MTVVATGELHDLVLSGKPACQTYGGHRGLGSGRHEPDAFDVGHHLGDQASKFDFELARSAERRPPGRGLGDRRDDLRMSVTEQQSTPALYEVDVAVAIDVDDLGPRPPRDEEWFAPDRVERAHGTVDTARDQRSRIAQQFVGPIAHRPVGSYVSHSAAFFA